jgi:outer membrane protein assembly factor BamB
MSAALHRHGPDYAKSPVSVHQDMSDAGARGACGTSFAAAIRTRGSSGLRGVRPAPRDPPLGGDNRLVKHLDLKVLLALVIASAFSFNTSPGVLRAQDPSSAIPNGPLKFGMFISRFDAGGTFSIEGKDWSPLKGTWKASDSQIELVAAEKTSGCERPGTYRFRLDGAHVSFDLVSDTCDERRILLDRSTWVPAEEAPAVAARHIVRAAVDLGRRLPVPVSPQGSWPSFRGPQASGVADDQNLPDRWNVQTRENILWRRPIPGLGHSSPVVWGDRIFVTTAISSNLKATFRPGLYGDGDASDDRSRHRFVISAIDKRNGSLLWERTAFEGPPVDKRHIKSTYASSTPATDGRIVVAWFGSQGVYAYDVNGNLRWKVDLGHLDLGAYNIPSLEWGPASSPVIWNDLVILQCDTHADSFLLALKVDTGEVIWKTNREELPSWGTPTVAMTSRGPELVTNASNLIRGYDPQTGTELWRLGGSSLITAPTPVYDRDAFVIASGRAPERPIFVVRAGARGDITLTEGSTHNDAVVWSRTGRGSYMPTPLAYDGILYVLANNGVFDAYDLTTGTEFYRQRMPEIGSGFSASPVAADGKIYVSSEDGEIFVLGAGPAFKRIATNSMGELIMATPALSEGVMYVRSAQSLFAVGRKR